MQVDLLTDVIATNGAPTLATQGAKMPHMTKSATLFAHSTAGSGSMTVTLRFWIYSKYTGKWYPFGTGTAAAKGTLNAGAAIAEDATTGADTIVHAQTITDLYRADRVYLEVAAIGGTDTAITAVLDCVPTEGTTH